MNIPPATHSRPPNPGWSFSGLTEKEVFQLGYSIGLILKRAGQKLGITPQELLGPSRQAHVVAARHVAVLVLQNRHPNLALTELGILLGLKRDRTRYAHHTAVISLTLKNRLYLHAQKAFLE